MDDQDLGLDFEDLGGDPDGEELEADLESNLEADTEAFYWALKRALDRTRFEPPPGQVQ